MKTNFGKAGCRKRNSEGRQARLAQVEGLSSQGDVDQRRQGWGQAGNKPSFSECGNTDRFKAQCHIWKAKKKRWTSTNPTSATEGGEKKEVNTELKKRKRGSVRFAFLETSEAAQQLKGYRKTK